MSGKPGIREVIAGDLCIACGACIQACPHGLVQPGYDNQNGAQVAWISKDARCDECVAYCDKVCPSIEMDFAAHATAQSECAPGGGRTGNVRAVRTGYSPAFRDNGVTSSGGVVRAILHDALAQGIPVVCLGWDGAMYRAMSLTAADDLAKVPGSIYHSVTFMDGIARLRASTVPAVLVATPCQLEGIEKYIESVEPTLREKIHLSVGLICGWMYSDHAIHAFASFKHIREPVLKAEYRGENQVGLLKLHTATNAYRFERRRFSAIRDALDYRAAFSAPANRLRCRLCQNHINLLADVAVGDAWLARSQGVKQSILVIRSARAEAEMTRLQNTGVLVCAQADWGDVVASQSADLVYGHTARRMTEYLKARDHQTPAFTFGADQEEDNPTPQHGYAGELMLRHVLRRGHYRVFRRLYTLLNGYRILRLWLSMAMRKHLRRQT